ncbi:MAG: hypothetical protein ACLUE1_05055 [Adlercreutzia equolifaciens]
MEIDEAVIRVDNHAEIDEVEPIEISDDEARRVRLYENFYQVNAIDPALYAQHDVKRGLRNADGTGVLAGMTNISNVHGYVMSDGETMPAEGRCAARLRPLRPSIWIRRAASLSKRWPICCSWASCRRRSVSTASWK